MIRLITSFAYPLNWTQGDISLSLQPQIKNSSLVLYAISAQMQYVLNQHSKI